MNSNFGTFFALLHRDMLLLKRNIVSKLLDGLFTSMVIVITMGYLLPAIGLPAHMIAPLFINVIFNTLFTYGFTMAVNVVYEVKNKGRIFYSLTLPISKSWVIAERIVSFVIEVTVMTIPIMLLGGALLHNKLGPLDTNWPLFACMSLASLLFFGLFMLLIGIHYERSWFLDNIWARRLSPMYGFGATFYLWKAVYAFAPAIALITLVNPMVYISEGIRGSFIGGTAFLPTWICLGMTSLFCLLTMACLSHSIKKRLDPV